jgi:ubiquinone/menaquinone biosynthesis C-methylase UbiE
MIRTIKRKIWAKAAVSRLAVRRAVEACQCYLFPVPFPKDLPGFHWFDNAVDYQAFLNPGQARRRAGDRQLGTRKYLRGFCPYCRRGVAFQVNMGLFMDEGPNLREGMVCCLCGLGNRLRLIYKAVEDHCQGPDGLANKRIYIAERITRFYSRLARRIPNLVGSEYLNPSLASGQIRYHRRSRKKIMHQDLRHTSFPENTFDIVLHADVLEHVPQYLEVLREMHRILAPGGCTIFSVPFYHRQNHHNIRAILDDKGKIRHQRLPEIHGNPLDESGSLVFQTFGWSLLEDLRSAGFTIAQVGVLPDCRQGFTSNNASETYFMEAVIFKAQKAGK